MNRVMKANVYAAKEGMTQEAWLESRRKGIGGSDAAAIVGLHPYKSAFAVFMDKLGFAPEVEDNEAMRLGRDLEEYVAYRFRLRMKEKGTPKRTKVCNYILQHRKYPFMLANVDRLIVGESAGLECKTTSVLNLRRFKGGMYPVEYYAQCLHYLAVTGADRWYLGVLVLNKDFFDYTIEREEAQGDIDNLIAAEKAFWESNVLARAEPSPDGSGRAGELIAGLYPKADGETEIDLSPYDADIERYMELNGEIKQRETEQEAIKQRIQTYMKEAAGGRTEGYRVSWRNVECRRLDNKLLKTEQPGIYEQYLKQYVTRPFKINEIQ